MSKTFKSKESIKNYINGVKTMHLLLGYKVDHINNYILILSIKGMAKLKPYCVRQAAPMTPELSSQIASILDFTKKLVYPMAQLNSLYLYLVSLNYFP